MYTTIGTYYSFEKTVCCPTMKIDSNRKIIISIGCIHTVVESSLNVMAHGDTREGK